MDVLATNRAKVAEPHSSRRGGNLIKEGVKSMAVGHISGKLGVAAIKKQCIPLFGRLDSMGPDAVMAAGRRRRALDLENIWAKERRADAFAAE